MHGYGLYREQTLSDGSIAKGPQSLSEGNRIGSGDSLTNVFPLSGGARYRHVNSVWVPADIRLHSDACAEIL